MGYFGPRAGGEYVGRTANDGRPVPTYTGGYGSVPGAVNLYPPTYESCVAQLGMTPSGLYTFDEASGALVDKTYAASLTRSAAAAGWTEGASSVETTAGECRVSCVALSVTTVAMFGLSKDDPDAGYASIQFALYRDGTSFKVYENGSLAFTGGTIAIGDVLEVRHAGAGSYPTYWQNGVQQYESATATSDALRVDTSLQSVSGTLKEIRFTIAGVVTPITWQNVVGCTANAAANNLAATGTPTYGDIVSGRRGIDYTATSDRHDAAAHPIGATESALVVVVGTMGHVTTGLWSHAGGTGVTPQFLFFQYNSQPYWKVKDNAANTVQLGPFGTAVAGERYCMIGQLARTEVLSRGYYVRPGRAAETSSGSSAAIGAIALDTWGFGYISWKCPHRDWAAFFRGPQCDGSTVPATLARNLGFSQ